MYHRLKYHAPRRETVLELNNLYSSCKWTLDGALAVVRDGGWFGNEGDHDFETGVGAFVREAQELYEFLIGGAGHANTH